MSGRSVFQSRDWLTFLEMTQDASPVLAVVESDGEAIGYFTGALVRRYGIRILGSPLRGWATSYMGFTLGDERLRSLALEALPAWAFGELRCQHVEVLDRRLHLDQVPAGYEVDVFTGYEVELGGGLDAVFRGFKSECRTAIRKAAKSNVVVGVASDALEFASEYYAQLTDVFSKQGLAAPYPLANVEALVRSLPPDKLLLAVAQDGEGRPAACGIFPADRERFYFWGGASWRQRQHLRPNEAVQWFAMSYWAERGVDAYDMGGGGEYKAKYGGRQIATHWIRLSRWRTVAFARQAAKAGVRTRRRTLHRLRQLRGGC